MTTDSLSREDDLLCRVYRKVTMRQAARREGMSSLRAILEGTPEH